MSAFHPQQTFRVDHAGRGVNVRYGWKADHGKVGSGSLNLPSASAPDAEIPVGGGLRDAHAEDHLRTRMVPPDALNQADLPSDRDGVSDVWQIAVHVR